MEGVKAMLKRSIIVSGLRTETTVVNGDYWCGQSSNLGAANGYSRV